MALEEVVEEELVEEEEAAAEAANRFEVAVGIIIAAERNLEIGLR